MQLKLYEKDEQFLKMKEELSEELDSIKYQKELKDEEFDKLTSDLCDKDSASQKLID